MSHGFGVGVGAPLTYAPSSYCEQFTGTIASAPAYDVRYYKTWTPCSGGASAYSSPCSMYSTQSECSGNVQGYHTMMSAYGDGGMSTSGGCGGGGRCFSNTGFAV